MSSYTFPHNKARNWLEINGRKWYNLIIPLLVLLSSPLFAMLGTSLRRPFLILLLPSGVLIILSFFRWPVFGLLSLIVGSLVIPFSIGTGTETLVPLPVMMLPLLIGFWVFRMASRREQLHLISSRSVWASVTLAVISVIAFIFGQYPWYPIAGAPLTAQLAEVAIFILLVGAFLLVAHQIADLYSLQWLTWVFLTVGSIYVIGEFVPALQIPVRRFQWRTIWKGGAIWTWIVTIAFSQAVFNRDLPKGWRGVVGTLFVLAMYRGLIIRRDWVAGWFPALISAAVVLWIGLPRMRWPMALMGIVAVIFGRQVFYDYVFTPDNMISYSTRIVRWVEVLRLTKVSPIIGLGPANYYRYMVLNVVHSQQFSMLELSSHNQYVDLVAQTGVLGLLSFLWFVLEIGFLCWRLQDKVPSGFARAYLFGTFGGLIGTLALGMLEDWIIPYVYNTSLNTFRTSVIAWIFWGGIVVLEKLYGKDLPTEETDLAIPHPQN